ncbi:hypothetical protein MNO14_08205 [Luteimonas sp. S4-F44]|uniref:hypothetical protein n=1 Tax=Luteimonas sp. S4-F44 TaxID=2925842 RepID=UPI001F52FEB1|nr:hypothetical protein [Luteimonas sp. S4-F44]UNK44016.1 hypothetical protein MNO14_08205 [Luteimonas sp. S4-F44]
MKSNIVRFTDRAASALRTTGGKIAAGVTGMAASGLALAEGEAAAVAAEVSGGKAEMGQIFAAVAILIGALLVWTYIKKSAR